MNRPYRNPISAITAAAEPPEEPPATRVISTGFLGAPYTEVSEAEPIANSSILALPSSTAPCARSFCHTAAS